MQCIRSFNAAAMATLTGRAEDIVGWTVRRVSAFGTKRTFQRALSMSAFGGKADIAS